ncbi:hypothetical protein [Actinopolymorpha singaporensis]|uniref:Uncharacterized protein n=1 Tax=Actinopolymorpha singaporensis TaxID=117157 RepID=A0A1H1UTM0_9ACTN|nr:hypothetical protein [Actinopolymorpha singaporensis]SDS75938.1 hypothetical protein SAMN04489717_3773 [Actinopolymorpha singaporensis]
MTTGGRKRVVIVCQLDGFGNSVKPVEIHRYLTSRGHEVCLVDTYRLSRSSARPATLAARLPRPRPYHVALYAVEVVGKLTRPVGIARRRLSYHLLRADFWLRRRILRSGLALNDVDLVICETPYDSGLLLDVASAETMYDCPTPWADELLYEGRLTRRQHARLRQLEIDVLESVDHLSFHWESYADYAREHYRIPGSNLVTLNWGCSPAAIRARPASPARVVYFGSLSSRFVNLPLLSRLSRSYPYIDVYGGPPPDPALGIRYRGYASPDVLRDYQFGLITCVDDPLRRDGFSAKHLDYLAAGLPVLVPAWRRSAEALAGSLPYDEKSFADIVTRHVDPVAWQRVSDEAYAQAERLRWEHTLRPLDALLDTTAAAVGP